MKPYEDFLRQKIKLARFDGFDVDPAEINPGLKPHTKDIVRWALKGGNRAVFASFGLHKTATNLEVMRLIGVHRPGLRLITAPLGVRQEFFQEVEQRFQGEYAVNLRFIRKDSEIGDERTIYITNYESVREGKINPRLFRAGGLDEASVLRSYSSKTYQEFLPLYEGVEFKYVYTATPSPNRYKELIHYAAFLGQMDSGQALTRFFKRDPSKAGNLTLYPHKEQEFWLWVASWAVFIQKPSDLGYSDEGYDLPPLDLRLHEIPSDYAASGADKRGQGLLVPDVALGLSSAAKEKRQSMPARVDKLMEIIHAEIRQSRENRVQQNVLSEESRATSSDAEETRSHQGGDKSRRASRIPETVPNHEQRHSSGKATGTQQTGLSEEQGEVSGAEPTTEIREIWSDEGIIRCDPAETRGAVSNLPAVSSGIEYPIDRSFARDGRGAGDSLSSMQHRPGATGREPGKSGEGTGISEHTPALGIPQMVIWCDLNDEQRAIEHALDAVGITYASLYGSQNVEDREELIAQWRAKRLSVFLSKTSMYGSGVNLQQASRMMFVGVHYKFNDLIQAIHRIHRFQQYECCRVSIIHTEAEQEVLRTLMEKWRRYDAMVQKMTDIIKKYGLNQLAMQEVLARSIGVERIEVAGELYTVANNDCVDEAKLQPENSVDLIVTSIPFANHYEYSPSYNDFGHTENNEHFWRQMDYLTPELLRILKPGRIYCCHTKDRINFGNVTGAGVPTVSPFHAEALFHGLKHGFDYLGMITVVTDVVRENNQTYRLGYTEMCKDGTKMGVGSPEYILLFHKPQSDRSRGYADDPVVKSKSDYSLAKWQVDAHAFWRSNGNRLITAEEMARLGPGKLAKMFTDYSLQNIYDYEFHVKIGEELLERQALPSTFMSLAPGSHNPNVWHDVNRMITLNGDQARRDVEQHVCPLQFDIVDRLIERYSNKGELVYDPFCGLGTVPYRAIKLGRRGQGSELNTAYFFDSVHYLKAAEQEAMMPTLFETEEIA